MSSAPTSNGNGSTNGLSHTTTVDGPPSADDTPNLSPLQRARLSFAPQLNPLLSKPSHLTLVDGAATSAVFDVASIEQLFPHLFGQPIVNFTPVDTPTVTTTPKTIGVVLSGGPAPGGHNVIAGLYDFVNAFHADSKVLGFLAGPDGILKCNYETLTANSIAPFRNQGGFHMIGTGRTKIETDDQFAAARHTASVLGLDALVVVGGDDSNSNAMKLAEDFAKHGVSCAVNGVPKTIDNDLRNDQVEVSFGFDTASKNYAQLVAGLALDAQSARKAWHFVRVMGRSASHIALEVALQTHPNICFIGEEVEQNGVTLVEVVKQITDVVVECADDRKNYGVVVLPEGLVEFMPDVEALIVELNELLSKISTSPAESVDMKAIRPSIIDGLSDASARLFLQLPEYFANELMMERDPHGNVQVAKIEAERLLIGMVSQALLARKKHGLYKGKFNGVPHYLGYEARCALPSNFDSNYTYGLGRVAGALCCHGKTGYIATLRGLTKPACEWIPAGFPLTMMMNIERRKGRNVAVIKKKLVDLQGKAFNKFTVMRGSWRLGEHYRSPGPVQFWGAGSDDTTLSMMLDACY